MRAAGAAASLGPMKSPSLTYRPWAALALTLLALTGTAGCTGGSAGVVTDSPTSVPSATSSPAPTASPSPTASAAALTDAELLALLPADAAYPDTRGAIATAVFFLDEYNRIYLTGNFRVWDALSGPDCEFCSSSRDGAAELHEDGSYREGGEFTIDNNATRANVHSENGLTYVLLEASWAATNDFHPDGTTTVDSEGGSAQVAFEFEFVDGVWHVLGVGVEPHD